MDDLLKQLLQEEQELQFASFNEVTSWQVGSQLVERSMRERLAVTIDITRGKQQLFHASLPGTSADNDEWIRRKVRLVYRFGHSSLYMNQLLKSKGKSLEDAYFLPQEKYGPFGGSFPVLIRGSGMVGTITVSGLPQEDDHRLVVETIRSFLTIKDADPS
jgi:uncharacterized protein (UPF0303 family)